MKVSRDYLNCTELLQFPVEDRFFALQVESLLETKVLYLMDLRLLLLMPLMTLDIVS